VAVSQRLSSLEVLALDCQTTGANPENGHLLEIAWSRGRAADSGWSSDPEVTSFLVRLPGGKRIPRRITRITGIEARDLRRAIAPREVWRRLLRAVGSPPRRAVAHFARFERAFLEALQREHAPGRPFPLDLICTHELACRIFPGLPRRGLRATAGDRGHVMHREQKRAASHVRATVAVWSEIVRRLRRDHGVTTLAELNEWTESIAPTRRAGRDFAVARESRLALPEGPGVYRMLGKGGEVLYLGKATSLKRRVNSYFQHRRGLPESTWEMLAQTFEISVTETVSALEAALLETDEIKRRSPPYNVALRERRPQVWFACRDDLRRVRPRPDSVHCVGPLPRPDAVTPLAAVGRILSGSPLPPEDPEWVRALGLDRETGPPRDGCPFPEGLAVFRSRHRAASHALGSLLRLGARLWRRRLAEAARRREVGSRDTREPEAETAEDPASPQNAVGKNAVGKNAVGRNAVGRLDDPARIADGFESAVAQAAHLVRRARWFGRLLECSLLWETANGRRRQLVIERGRVIQATDVAPETRRAALPPGHRRSPDERLAGLNFRTYDRLRVLTTELKRIVARQAMIELRFGPEIALDPNRLGRRLYWV